MGWASYQNLLIRTVNQAYDAVPVVWGSIVTEGLLRKDSEIQVEDRLVIVDAVLRNIPTALLGGLSYGELITVAGQAYRVEHDPIKLGDGAYCSIPLNGPIRTPAFEPSYLRSTRGTLLRTAANVPLVAS